MLRIQLSLAVLATAFALFAGSGEAEARHCQNQCRPHHHRQSQNCNRGHIRYNNGSYGSGGSGYSNYGGVNLGWNNAGADAYGRTGNYGNGHQGYSY